LISTYLSNPLETIQFKSRVLAAFWNTNNTENYLGRPAPVESFIFFVTTIVATILSVARLKLSFFLSTLWLSQIFVTLTVLLVFHVEARDLIFLKIAGVIVLALHLRPNSVGDFAEKNTSSQYRTISPYP
jgi:hypothetical protein